MDVGLNYLSLDRSARSFQGERVSASGWPLKSDPDWSMCCISLMNPVLACIRGITKLIASLQKLRDQGNSVIVVEHDKEMILSADHVVDLGPGAGRLGGDWLPQDPRRDPGSKTLTADI